MPAMHPKEPLAKSLSDPRIQALRGQEEEYSVRNPETSKAEEGTDYSQAGTEGECYR